MWICEKETHDMGNVSQPGGQSRMYAKVGTEKVQKGFRTNSSHGVYGFCN